MSMRVGTKVRVSPTASYHVGRACKAAKKTYLLGVIRTPKDPCCGCYIVEFNRNIGTDGTYGGKGKAGYCDEIQPEFMTVVGEEKAKAKKAVYVPKVGDMVRWTGGNQGPAKPGAIAIVRVVDGPREVGLEFIRGYKAKAGHDLDGSVKGGAGWWVSTDHLEPVGEFPFKVGDKVEIIERHDDAQVGMKGTVVVVDKDRESHPFGIQFPGWDGGHSLDGRLKGNDRLQGQWVPASSLEFIAKGTAVEATASPFPTRSSMLRSEPKPFDGAVLEKGFQVKVLKSVTTALGENRLNEGSRWSASRLSGYYDATYFLIPFGLGKTILVHSDFIEVL